VPTCALLPTSLAIHHGYNPMGLLYDARGVGYSRTNTLGQTDMGAYEYGSQPASIAGTGTVMLFW